MTEIEKPITPAQSNKERLNAITDSIEAGIQDLFQSEKYAEYLRTTEALKRSAPVPISIEPITFFGIPRRWTAVINFGTSVNPAKPPRR